MLIILIPIAWLAIIALVVAACRAAAHGDDTLAHAANSAPIVLPTRVRWQDGPALTAARHVERARAFGGSGRSRGARCAVRF